jgi:hypothetical protein
MPRRNLSGRQISGREVVQILSSHQDSQRVISHPSNVFTPCAPSQRSNLQRSHHRQRKRGWAISRMLKRAIVCALGFTICGALLAFCRGQANPNAQLPENLVRASFLSHCYRHAPALCGRRGLRGTALPLEFATDPDQAPRAIEGGHPSAEILRVVIDHHRIRLGRVSTHRPPLQTRQSDSSGFGGSQEFIKRISIPEHVRELIQPGAAIACPPSGSYLEEGRCWLTCP